MVICESRFNINLVLITCLAMLCGCQTADHKSKKAQCTFRVHQQVNRDPAGNTEEISVGRDHPVKFLVQKNPFLNESNIKEAKVVDVIGGFALRVEFDRKGKWLLEEYTVGSGGRHFAIFSQFVPPQGDKLNEGRWLAAPRISQRISDGVLLFTIDASREEAEQIAQGLNYVAKKTHEGMDADW